MKYEYKVQAGEFTTYARNGIDLDERVKLALDIGISFDVITVSLVKAELNAESTEATQGTEDEHPRAEAPK